MRAVHGEPHAGAGPRTLGQLPGGPVPVQDDGMSSDAAGAADVVAGPERRARPQQPDQQQQH